MKSIHTFFNLCFFLVILHSTKAETVPFNNTWLPVVKTITSINSSSIQLVWQSSPFLNGVDIDKLNGTFSVNLYVGGRTDVFNKIVSYDADRLNTSDSITITELTPDTVYHSCLDTKWDESNETIADNSQRIIPPPSCRLVRTFTTGKLNR